MLIVQILFYTNRSKIVDLRRQLHELENYFDCPDIMKYELRIRKIVKIVTSYTVIAGITYIIGPMMDTKSCEKERESKQFWPCGMHTPLWFPFAYDSWPSLQILQIFVFIDAIRFDFMAFNIRFFQYAIIRHTVRHLKNLERNLKICIDSKGRDVTLKKCVEYHVAIVK